MSLKSSCGLCIVLCVSQEVKAAADSFFQLLLPLVSEAEAATLSSIINSSKDLQLYSKTLVQACLARAKGLLEQQLQGFVDAEAGFSGRRLGVLLHGLAALGLRPSEEFLRLAVTVAGACGDAVSLVHDAVGVMVPSIVISARIWLLGARLHHTVHSHFCPGNQPASLLMLRPAPALLLLLTKTLPRCSMCLQARCCPAAASQTLNAWPAP
jgi:hypothetical protein